MTIALSEPSHPAVRVLIVDDHDVVRKGIRAVLAEATGFEIVGEAADGQEAVLRARETLPDVILMDLLMPVMDGVEATRQIIASQPGTGVLVLTSFATDKDLFPALQAGALGYMLKDASPTELARGIRRVAKGEASLDPEIAHRLMLAVARDRNRKPEPEMLTVREVEVLRLLAAGLSNKALAARMMVSDRTARTHVSHILAKLHLTSRTQAAVYAIREGLADPTKLQTGGE